MARMTQAALAGCAAVGQRSAQRSTIDSDRQRRSLDQQRHTQQAQRTQHGIGVDR